MTRVRLGSGPAHPSQSRLTAHPRGGPLGSGQSALANGHGGEAPRESVDSGLGCRPMAVTHHPTGLVLVEHEFEVPLDHAAPDGERITVFAREVADPDGRER